MAEDIDLFASGLVNGAAASAVPNVIFVLDNTSNWSRQSQQWPDGKQGESEVQAIYDLLDELRVQGKNLNVALMEFTTGGTANQDGGYVRHKLQLKNVTPTQRTATWHTISTRIWRVKHKVSRARAPRAQPVSRPIKHPSLYSSHP
jgi:hypothetical protein